MTDAPSQNDPRGAHVEPTGSEPLDARALTWAALLARWTQFAKASVALPKDAAGERWRASVAPVVGLQAVVFALSDMGDLPADERALGVDRAAALVDKHTHELETAWRGERMHPELGALIGDALVAVRSAREAS